MPLQSLEFDSICAVVQNNAGLLGQLNVKSTDGTAVLCATLGSNEPDNSDDDARASCTLTVELTRTDGAPLLSKTITDYEYHGDDPGDHLLDLLDADVLLCYLTGTPVC